MRTMRDVCGKMSVRIMLGVFVVAGAANAQAQSVSPYFTYQGRAFQSDGTTPLKHTVSFKLQIYNGSGSCLLYEELQSNIDLNATNGLFNLTVGQSSTSGGKRGTSDPGLSMARVFSNTGEVRPAGTNCPGGYTPVSGEGRLLRVIIDDSGTLITMNPDQKIYSVPYAVVADSVQGYSADKLVKITGSITQTDFESVMAKKTELLSLAAEEANLIALANGSSSTYLKSSLGGTALSNTGNITMGTQKSLQLGSFTTTEQNALTLGTSDKGKTWFNSTTGKLMYWDGTAAKAVADGLTSLNGESGGSQTLATSTSGTNLEWASSGGTHTLKIPMASAGAGVGAGLISNAEYQALATKTYCDAKLASKALSAPTLAENGQSIRWNNTSGSWEYFTPSAALASVSVTAPLTSTGGTTPTLALDIAAGLKVDGSNKLAPDFGTASGKIAQGNDSRFNPSFVVGDGGKFARLNDGGTAYVLRTAAEVRTDLGLGTMATAASSDYMAKTDNLTGLGNAATARTNLGLGGAAVLNVGAGLTSSGGNLVPDFGTASGKVAQGNDSRFNPSFVAGDAGKFARLNDTGTSYILRTTAEVRTDLGLGGAALLSVGTGSGTVAAGNDSRFNPSFTAPDGGKFARLNDGGTAYVLRTPAEVKTDLGLGSAAGANTGDILLASNALSEISGAGAIAKSTARANLGITTIGDTIATAANAAAVNTALGVKGAGLLDVGTGLTTSSGTLVPDFGTAAGKVAQGNDKRFNPTFTAGTDDGKFVRIASDGSAYILRTAAEIRTDLGLGSAADNNDADMFLVTNAFSELSTALQRSTARANLGITSTGESLVTAANAGAARTAIGSTATGDSLITAASAGAARTALGSTSTGDSLFTAASATAARTALGSGVVGDPLFTAATASAARTTLGAGATGDSLFQAATAATARTTLGLGTSATVDTGTTSGKIPVLDGSNKLATSMIPDLAGSIITSGTVDSARLPAAATGAAGIVSTGTQSFDGAKTFNSNVGVGVSGAPSAKLDVGGQLRATQADGTVKVNNTNAVDWNNGNVQKTTNDAACVGGSPDITFTNMLDGGAYTLAVPGSASTTKCVFAHSGLTFKYSGNGTTSPDREANKDIIYTFLRIGTTVYVSYVSDF